MLQYTCKMMIDLRNDSGAKYVFETNTICDFLLKASDSYSNVGKEALKKLLLFPSTYLCESGFYPSARENKKSKPTRLYSRKRSEMRSFHNAAKN